MRNSQPINITLPEEIVTMIKAKVTSGEYASESDVIRAGLRSLQDRDAAIEAWLREDVAESYDALAANPALVIPANDMMARLRTSYRERQAKRERE